MTKKYFLSIFFITLSISANYLKANTLIPTPLNFLVDIITYPVELNNIAIATTENPAKIKNYAIQSLLKNLIMGGFCTRGAIDAASKVFTDFPNTKTQTKITSFSLLFHLYLLAANITFASYDKKIIENSNTIAKVNKNKKSVAFNNKAHIGWLTFNQLFPYIILIFKRLVWDKANIKNALSFSNADQKSSTYASIYLFHISRLLSKLSEVLRKSMLYKRINEKIIDK